MQTRSSLHHPAMVLGSGNRPLLRSPPTYCPSGDLSRRLQCRSAPSMRPPGPPSLDSAQWVADYNEVKALGAANGSSRTPEQSLIALFWSDGPGTETPPGHWNRVAQHVSADRRSSLEETARLFALLNIAMADAAICAWDAKYTYDFWRPVTAIRNGEADGNPATVADPCVDVVHRHAAVSGLCLGSQHVQWRGRHGAGGVLRDRQHQLHARIGRTAGVTRAFTSFSAAAREAAISRLYAGIHFRTASEDGLSAGIAIGEWTVAHYLQPKKNRSRR